jgi:hypothetical protein
MERGVTKISKKGFFQMPLINSVNTPGQASSSKAKHKGKRPDKDENIRKFLVAWTTFLTVFFLLVYLKTGDTRILVLQTMFTTALAHVFSYYFERREGR